MSKRIFAFSLAAAMSSQASMAQVPNQALTFKTNVVITNASSTMTSKIRLAEDYIKKVISTDEFRDQVINHTYNGVRTFVDNGGFTNEQIYQKMLDGAERLNKLVNNTMDMELVMYYENSTTVGYTTSGSPKIYANTRFYDDYSAGTITGNMTHEWLHKLGFSHAVSYSTSRDYSVPYAIGTIMRRLANTTYLGYITAASNVTVSNTTTAVSLKWSPATSSEGIEEYKVYRRLDGSTTTYLQASTTGLTFSQAKPSSAATYYIKAVDQIGKTANSAEVRYVPLSPVKNLVLTKTTSSVNLSWSQALSSAGVKEYKIYRRLKGSTTNYLQGTTTLLKFTQARPSTSSATYFVRAVDLNGETAKSLEVQYQK